MLIAQIVDRLKTTELCALLNDEFCLTKKSNLIKESLEEKN
jgi:hypothetical protein